MASVTVKDFGEFQAKIKQLAERDLARINKRAVYAGAGIIADRIKANLEDNLRDPAYAGLDPSKKWAVKQRGFTGDMLEAFGIAPISQNKDGDTSTKIGFSGYDRNGVANALKARAMESGTSVLAKRPFVAPAVRAMRTKAENAMKSIVETETMKILSL